MSSMCVVKVSVIASVVLPLAASRTASAADVTIDMNSAHQVIDGFGAAQPGGDLNQVPVQDSAYELYCFPNVPSTACQSGCIRPGGTAPGDCASGGPARDAALDLAFSDLHGIGLTLLRMKINVMMESFPGFFNDTDPAQAWVMQQASSRGPVKVFASVWSPPPWMKDTPSTLEGRIDPDHLQAYAEFLAHFAGPYAAANGVKIYAVSIANEPENEGGLGWDVCGWNAYDIDEFLASYLAPTFAARNITAKVIAPEAADWEDVEGTHAIGLPLLSRTYSDPAALARLDIAAGHTYGGDPAKPYQTALNAGKRVWQTEYSTEGMWSIDTALDSAVIIHKGLAGAQISGWVWFILFHGGIGNNQDSGPIAYDTSGNVAGSPVLYALGNFSKFIRPGFVRVDAVTSNGGSNFFASAYKDPATGQLVIVAINKNSSPISVNFHVGFAASATPYVTSSAHNLEAMPDVSLAHAVAVPARSIVTYVAQPPRLVSDILWRNTSGRTMVWLNAVAATESYPGTVGSDWQIQGIGDFDGNGRGDILWRSNRGDNVIWSDGRAPGVWIAGVDTGWRVVGIGDFDGDGRSDILWRSIYGDNAIWPAGQAPGYWLGGVDNSWRVAGIGDFDGDGRSDILWRSVNGDNVVWPSGNAPGFWISALDNNWQVQGVGDFDGNGEADIAWRCVPQAPATACGNAVAGQVAIWQFWNGSYYGWTTYPGALDGNWQIHGVGDFDGNGESDLLWRCVPQAPATACGNAVAGSVAIWQFADGAYSWTTWPGALDASWQIQSVGRIDR